jgi:hypothetical protein
MIKKYFQIEREDIVVVQFIIEGYGEMATVSTMDSRMAIIQISIMPDFISDMSGLLEYLKIKYNMKEVADYQKK